MRVLDLFSGIGGFSLGLERAGMETVAFCEIDPWCQKVLKKHWPDVPVYPDIKRLSRPNELLEYDMGGLIDAINDSPIDLVCGGFPCQDISVAGQKRGIDGDRSGLWKEFYRLIKEISPRWVIIENVANLRNLGLARVVKDLWKIGYECEWHIISARSVGACHLRERIWIIAYPNSEGLERQWEPFRVQKEFPSTNLSNAIVTNSNVPRLWRPFASEEEKSEWWAETTSSFRDWWKIESGFCRVDDGIPRGLDKIRRERIKMLGNAIVPCIAELIGKEVMKLEE